MRADMKIYAKGVIALVIGGAGLAENITSGRGSFLISAVVFGIGFALVCVSYIHGK